jgi:hypothetical protein
MQVHGTTILAAPSGANTEDIIAALCNVVPAAIAQVKSSNEIIFNKTGDPIRDAVQCCRYIRNNVKYKADGFDQQIIQLPGRMILNTHLADCKSFALAFVSIISSLGYQCGFRFASYKENKIPTHVYNFVICNGKKFTFDACVSNLKESPRYTFIKDMEVKYLAGTPMMAYSDTNSAYIGRKGKGKAKFKKIFKGAKKVALAAPRNAFNALVALNVRSLATKIAAVAAKDKSKLESFWNKLGGNPSKLIELANKSKGKKPLFGKGKGINGVGFYADDSEDAYIGIATEAALAAAAPIILAATKLFKSLKIGSDKENDELVPEGTEPIDPDGTGFEAADPEPGAKTSSASTTSFTASPMLIGGIAAGALALYFITKKK